MASAVNSGLEKRSGFGSIAGAGAKADAFASGLAFGFFAFVGAGFRAIGSLAFLGLVGRGLGASERQDPSPIRSSGDQSRFPLVPCIRDAPPA